MRFRFPTDFLGVGNLWDDSALPYCNDASGNWRLVGITYQRCSIPGGHCYWEKDVPNSYTLNIFERMIGILIGGRIPPGQKSCFKRTIPRIENLWCSSLFPFQFHISHFVWPNQEIHVFAKNFDQLLSCFGWKNIWGVTFMTMLLVSSMSFGRLMAMPTKFHLASRWVTRHILVPGCHLPRFPVERGNAREGSVEPLSFGRVFYNRSNKTRRHNWVAGRDQQFDTEASDVACIYRYIWGWQISKWLCLECIRYR